MVGEQGAVSLWVMVGDLIWSFENHVSNQFSPNTCAENTATATIIKFTRTLLIPDIITSFAPPNNLHGNHTHWPEVPLLGVSSLGLCHIKVKVFDGTELFYKQC